jgi:hypothetical protein
VLRGEVKTLKTQLEQMQEDMSRLTSLVGGMLDSAYPSHKKRKMGSMKSFNVLSDSNIPSDAFAPYSIGSDLNAKVDELIKGDHVDAFFVKGRDNYANTSMAFNADDEQILSSLFALDSTEEINVLESERDFAPEMNGTTPLVEKLEAALSKLPTGMQEAFVNRMVAVISEPEAMHAQVDALTSLATSAAEEARLRLAGTCIPPENAQSVQLAASVLGAYLARYTSTSQQSQQGPSNTMFEPRQFSHQQSQALNACAAFEPPQYGRSRSHAGDYNMQRQSQSSIQHIPIDVFESYEDEPMMGNSISVYEAMQEPMGSVVPVSFESL